MVINAQIMQVVTNNYDHMEKEHQNQYPQKFFLIKFYRELIHGRKAKA